MNLLPQRKVRIRPGDKVSLASIGITPTRHNPKRRFTFARWESTLHTKKDLFMLAVISWRCDCGMNVKAMYETDGMTKVRCPKVSCKITHIVDGEITKLWIKKDDSTSWRPQQATSLTLS
ncbi:MAG: hypothetical protein DMG15_10725 [Acidobacteria bacterium]|nr:MAG: hypothetical protein DMG16_04565 [Acidobacteriota bacterium]PYS13591.1 MAG: hypothetical protein DMG15_10725 [Acidobacteriota bacterium]